MPFGTFLVMKLLFNLLIMSASFVTLWTVAHQAPLSMGFSRQEYWSGLEKLKSNYNEVPPHTSQNGHY